MNATDFIAVTKRTLLKAKRWEKELQIGAEVARAVGCEQEAETLEQMSARAIPSAEAYLESLHVEGV